MSVVSSLSEENLLDLGFERQYVIYSKRNESRLPLVGTFLFVIINVPGLDNYNLFPHYNKTPF